MNRSHLRQTLLEILETDTGNQYPNFDDSLNLREGLGLDSVDVVSMLMQIESRFRVRLRSEELENIRTVGQLLDLIESKVVRLAA
jgi:acyl carrier protein